MDIDELEVEDDDDLLAACGLTPLRLKSQPTASLRSDVTGKEPQCGLDNTQGGSWECEPAPLRTQKSPGTLPERQNVAVLQPRCLSSSSNRQVIIDNVKAPSRAQPVPRGAPSALQGNGDILGSNTSAFSHEGPHARHYVEPRTAEACPPAPVEAPALPVIAQEPPVVAIPDQQARLCRILPGPAGRLQKAMEAGVQVTGLDDVLSDNGTRAHNSEQNRAGDLDFSSEAWRTAMSTLDVEEFDASSPILQHNVASVKKRRAAGKIPQIILLVVSMKANTPGNILAKLKDPTGVITGAIHEKVLQAEPDISPGAVLMLKKVSFVMPMARTHCLCITLNNVAQVLPADTCLETVANHTDPDIPRLLPSEGDFRAGPGLLQVASLPPALQLGDTEYAVGACGGRQQYVCGPDNETTGGGAGVASMPTSSAAELPDPFTSASARPDGDCGEAFRAQTRSDADEGQRQSLFQSSGVPLDTGNQTGSRMTAHAGLQDGGRAGVVEWEAPQRVPPAARADILPRWEEEPLGELPDFFSGHDHSELQPAHGPCESSMHADGCTRELPVTRSPQPRRHAVGGMGRAGWPTGSATAAATGLEAENPPNPTALYQAPSDEQDRMNLEDLMDGMEDEDDGDQFDPTMGSLLPGARPTGMHGVGVPHASADAKADAGLDNTDSMDEVDGMPQWSL